MDASTGVERKYELVRGLGVLAATAQNMTNMVGFGPFVTIPLIIGAMGGPQCMLGWLGGAILSICDGMIWAELSAAMPGSGGTYLFLKEAFRKSRWGALLPFLFIWQFLAIGPLEVSSSYLGFARYAGFFFSSWQPWHQRVLVVALGLIALALLYRRIDAIGKVMVLLWGGMLLTVGLVIAMGLVNLWQHGPGPALDFPPGAFHPSRAFAVGLGKAMLIAMFDFLGYYSVCFVGGEVRDPARVMPRAILYSVLVVGAIYLVMNFCIIAVVPWREAMHSQFVVSDYVTRLYGAKAAAVMTVLVLWTAFTPAVPVLLGFSRIPYAAALDGYFFKPFAKLHAKQFPYVSLLVIGGLAILCGMIDLEWVISAMLTGRILIQFIAQIVAVHYLRRYRPDIKRPFKAWLYPLPSAVAFIGWSYILITSGWGFIAFGVVILLLGVGAFALWRRRAGLPVFAV